MKSNIDLTENRDFRKHRNVVLDLSKLFVDTHYPWSLYKEWDGENQPEVVLTGDKQQRKIKISWHTRESQCERCGYDFSKKHWNGSYGLCNYCNESMGQDIKYEHELVLGRFQKRQQNSSLIKN